MDELLLHIPQLLDLVTKLEKLMVLNVFFKALIEQQVTCRGIMST